MSNAGQMILNPTSTLLHSWSANPYSQGGNHSQIAYTSFALQNTVACYPVNWKLINYSTHRFLIFIACIFSCCHLKGFESKKPRVRFSNSHSHVSRLVSKYLKAVRYLKHFLC